MRDLTRLFDARRPVAREALLFAALALGVCALTFGSYAFHGGFYADDWANEAIYRFAPSPRLFEATRHIEHNLGSRPVLAFALVPPHAAFGADPRPHLALAIVLAAAAAACFFLVLRMAGLAAVPAGTAALLAMLFPWTDSVHFWSTVSVNHVAICLFLLGVAAALRAFTLEGFPALALHAAAVVLVLLSIATYEVAALATVALYPLYRTRASRRRALLPWLGATTAMLVATIASAASTSQGGRDIGTAAQRITDLPAFARQGVSLATLVFVPQPLEAAPAKAAVGIALIALFGWAAAYARRDDGDGIRASLTIAAAGAIVVACAYALLLGYYLRPLSPIGSNRGNIFAALGYALWVVGVATLAGRLAARRSARAGVIVPAAIVLLVAASFVSRLRVDERTWRQAAALQRRELAALRIAVPHLPSHAAVYAFGGPRFSADDVPVFADRYDLAAAVQLHWNDASLRAYPIFAGVKITCGKHALHPSGGKYGTQDGSRYGRAFFVDTSRATAERIDSRAQCRSRRGAFTPGPTSARG